MEHGYLVSNCEIILEIKKCVKLIIMFKIMNISDDILKEKLINQ
jgi:hypothetical protein